MKKIDFLNFMMFIVSPFMAIPSIIVGVIKRSKFSLFLLILMFGLVSYMYIPHYSNDRARYFEVYEDFVNLSFAEMFSFFFLNNQDFILQSLFYFASQTEIPAQLVFASVTMVTVSIIFFIYYRIIDRFTINNTYGLLSLIMIFLSISYLDLLSGTRFMFAASFVLLGYYLGIIEKSKWAILFLILATFIHFSVLIFIPIFLFLRFFSYSNNFCKIIFFFSFFFLFLPKEVLYSISDFLGLGGALKEKSNIYLNEDDFITAGLSGSNSDGGHIIYYISILNLFSTYLYLMITHKKVGVYRNIVLIIASVINLFYSVPTVFLRYALFFKMLFAFMLVYELYIHKNKKIMYLFGVIFFMNIITQIIISRNNIEVSFFNKESLMLITIVDKEKNSSRNFIY